MGDGISHGNRQPGVEERLEEIARWDSNVREALQEVKFWKHAHWGSLNRVRILEEQLKAAQEAIHG